jgi:hypothetical protein
MVSGHIFDQGARLRSFEILREIAPDLTGARVTQIPAGDAVSPGSATFVG